MQFIICCAGSIIAGFLENLNWQQAEEISAVKFGWKVKKVKILARTLMFALILALVCSSMLLVALAAEIPVSPYESDGLATIFRQNQGSAQPAAEPHAQESYGTQLRPEGLDLGFNPANAPALQDSVRIPVLETASETAQAYEEVAPINEPATPFVPSPNTGYVSSTLGVWAAVALLGSALVAFCKKPKRIACA